MGVLHGQVYMCMQDVCGVTVYECTCMECACVGVSVCVRVQHFLGLALSHSCRSGNRYEGSSSS